MKLLLSNRGPVVLARAVAVVGGLLLMAGAASGSGASAYSAPLIAYWNGSSWTQQASPNPEGSGSLTAVVALSAADVWAVGSYGIGGTDGKALAEHWDGSSWQQVAIPTPSGANEVRLYAMAAASATDVWAVGAWVGASTGQQYATLIEHWDGSSWAIVPSPSAGYSATLSGVTVLSSNDAWAVGVYARAVAGIQHTRTLVLHWDGSTWTRVASPHPGVGSGLAAVAAVSPTSVWAVGTYPRLRARHHPGVNAYRRSTLTVHWNGRQWKQVPSPNALTWGNALSAVAAVGRNNVWAVGGYDNGWKGLPLAEHWNGHKWQIVPTHSGYAAKTQALTGLAVLKGNDIWAVGHYQASETLEDQTLCEHWNGRAWSVVTSPNPAPTDRFSGIAAVTPTDVWAVGTYYPAPG